MLPGASKWKFYLNFGNTFFFFFLLLWQYLDKKFNKSIGLNIIRYNDLREKETLKPQSTQV